MPEIDKELREVEEILGTDGIKIIQRDIQEQIENRRNELETFSIERNNDDFVKGEIAGLRWLTSLLDNYRREIEAANKREAV